MNGFMADKLLTYDDVAAIPVPEYTRSWKPVPYADAIDYAVDSMESAGFGLNRAQYGTNKKGTQLFARFTWDYGNDDSALVTALRGSYDKSLANMHVHAKELFVCSNLMVTGDSSTVKQVRKNTVNVWRDFQIMVSNHIYDAKLNFDTITDETETWKSIGLSTDDGYSLIGQALGHGIIGNHVASVAFADWAKPRHPQFSEHNLFNLYQCFTEGLKKVRPAVVVEQQTAVHGLMRRAANA